MKEIEMNKYWIKKQHNFFVTDAAWYDKKATKKVRILAETVERVLPMVREILGLKEEDGYVVIGAIKAKRTSGCWHPCQKEARVDYRVYTVESCIETLAHELVHAQQYAQGRLTQKWGVFHWNSTEFGKHPTSYKKYLALPWEVEARAKAKEIVKILKEKGLLNS
jgi:hypothetical protein